MKERKMQEALASPGSPADTEGARRATGESAGGAPPEVLAAVPDPEVPAKARRRRFSAAYKLQVLREADEATEPGAIGALLRREGLYSSHLAKWREQREAGALEGLRPKKRGRKPKPVDRQAKRIAQLEREVERLHKKLEQAETIIEVQKKLSRILGTGDGS